MASRVCSPSSGRSATTSASSGSRPRPTPISDGRAVPCLPDPAAADRGHPGRRLARGCGGGARTARRATRCPIWSRGCRSSRSRSTPTLPPRRTASHLDAASSRSQLHVTVETFLDRLLTKPTLIVFEDAHWLDDASEFLLRHLVDRPGNRRWLVVVTRRPGVEPFANADAAHAARSSCTRYPTTPRPRSHSRSPRSTPSPRTTSRRSSSAPAATRSSFASSSRPRAAVNASTASRIGREPADGAHRHARARPTGCCSATPRSSARRSSSTCSARFSRDRSPDAGDPERWQPLEEFVRPPRRGVSRSATTSCGRPPTRAVVRPPPRDPRPGRPRARGARGERADEEAALLSLHFFEAGDNERAWTLLRHRGRAGRGGLRQRRRGGARTSGRLRCPRASMPDLPTPRSRACSRRSATSASASPRTSERSGRWMKRRAIVGDAGPILDTRLLGKQAAVLELMGRYDEALETCARGLARLDASGPRGPMPTACARRSSSAPAASTTASTNNEEAIDVARRAAEHADAPATAARSRTRTTSSTPRYTDSAAGRASLPRARAADLRGARRPSRPGHRLSATSASTRTTRGAGTSRPATTAESREAKERSGDVIGAAIQVNNEARDLLRPGTLEEAIPLSSDFLRVSRGRLDGRSAPARPSRTSAGPQRARALRRGALAYFDDALAVFEELSAERFKVETKARLAECLVFEGRHEQALATVAECRDAARKSPVGGLEALIERSPRLRPLPGAPARRGDGPTSRRACARAGAAGGVRGRADATRDGVGRLRRGRCPSGESDAILERLGVVSVPKVPLP